VWLDAYYSDLSQRPYEDRRKFNFDEPARSKIALSGGPPVGAEPGDSYPRRCTIFQPYARSWPLRRSAARQLPHRGRPFTFYCNRARCFHQDLSHRAGLVCLERRKERDIRERGRTLEFVYSKYDTSSAPENQRYNRATREFAVVGCSTVNNPIEETAAKITSASWWIWQLSNWYWVIFASLSLQLPNTRYQIAALFHTGSDRLSRCSDMD